MSYAKAWKESIVIPTYEIGEAEKLPVFLEKRVYQGSSGAVYPHPVVESISTEKTDKLWDVIYAENEFIKIMVIPDLGGRIHMAYDKVKDRHFIYHNRVIKPALVGLTGPWISGGIEFNWPQHHRPTTYQPIDSTIISGEDGSVTIWVNEQEKMFGLKGMAGFTLHPDKAYIEITGKIFNRTALPQTFLWWANPAVAVNDHYQSIFPPDVHAVFDHGKRDVSTFPIAKGEYYKVDYSPGTDISKYKNIPVPTSYMAVNSKYDFVGSYEHDNRVGMLHVSDHHYSPGKKQWTWGNGDFGQAWDRNLTDEDGPYIEIMCGVFTDNQPDFTWILPHEEKVFTQYYLPFHSLGGVKNATKDLLLNLDVENGNIDLKVFATSKFEDLKVSLYVNKDQVFKQKMSLSPEHHFEQVIKSEAGDPTEVRCTIENDAGEILLEYQGEASTDEAVPDPASAPGFPREVEHIEDLFLIGQHLEQYRHATYDPIDYYKEALNRDKTDLRCNNAMGLIKLRRGKLAEAETYFRAAIEKVTKRNPNPISGEYHYNLALTLFLMDRKQEAFDLFCKATWCEDKKEMGNFYAAAILCGQEKYKLALEKVEQVLLCNSRNHRARHLKTHLLYKLGLIDLANEFSEESLTLDPFNFGILMDRYLVSRSADELAHIKQLMRNDVHNFMELAQDFATIGDYESGKAVVEIAVGDRATYPMLYYFLGEFERRMGNDKEAMDRWEEAEKQPMDYCFPNRVAELLVLEEALKANPGFANAQYFIGNFWYAKREHESAYIAWKASADAQDDNAIVHRNLALYYYNKLDQKDLARQHLEQSFRLDNDNSRILMELDQLYKKMNVPLETRMNLLEGKWNLVLERDDLYLEFVTLLNLQHRHEEALAFIAKRQFQPWEGGEGKVPGQYLTAKIELAKQFIQDGSIQEAISHLNEARTYPENLGEGKLYGARENDIFYWLGVAHEAIGADDKAKFYWSDGAKGDTTISQSFFYNDQQPDKVFYQGLCKNRIGEIEEANLIFKALVDYSEQHYDDSVTLDYFAISLPDLLIWEEDLTVKNKINCLYLSGLGNLGLDKKSEAKFLLEKVMDEDSYHLNADIHLLLLKNLEKKAAHVVSL